MCHAMLLDPLVHHLSDSVSLQLAAQVRLPHALSHYPQPVVQAIRPSPDCLMLAARSYGRRVFCFYICLVTNSASFIDRKSG